ncbi:PAS domain-containing protein [Pelagibius sp. Alg239-R121]|uniref:PAS domain-containing protein n=1 Tax=Pelagibius sp. Alg239-R121 TaxID=2993448 RepID=UPI0024A6D0B2|nr:PAS domain-containing protein [Pelagibius sp. Alg239-R121]
MTLLYGKFSTEEILCESLRCFYTLWLDKHGPNGALPARADFDPIEIPANILPYLTIFDVIRSDDGLRFHIRLAGTGVVDEIGRDTTGLFLDNLPNTESIIERAEWIVENRKPVYVTDLPISWTSVDFKTYDALGVPLASDGKTVDKVFYQMSFS